MKYFWSWNSTFPYLKSHSLVSVLEFSKLFFCGKLKTVVKLVLYWTFVSFCSWLEIVLPFVVICHYLLKRRPCASVPSGLCSHCASKKANVKQRITRLLSVCIDCTHYHSALEVWVVEKKYGGHGTITQSFCIAQA